MFKNDKLYKKLAGATMLEPVYVMITKTTSAESKYVPGNAVVFGRCVGLSCSGLSVYFDKVYVRNLDDLYPHPPVRHFAITLWTEGLMIEEISEKEFNEEKRKNEVFQQVMAELTKPGSHYLQTVDKMYGLIVRSPEDARIEELQQVCSDMREVALMEAGY